MAIVKVTAPPIFNWHDVGAVFKPIPNHLTIDPDELKINLNKNNFGTFHNQIMGDLLKGPNAPNGDVIPPKMNNIDYTKISVSNLYKYKPLNKYLGFEGKIPVRAGTTFVGLEVELEKVRIKSSIQGSWAVVDDNSLKDNGKEFVTIPLQFKYLEVELSRLIEGLSSHHASKRCSIHVHLNARDFTLEELKSFLLLYMVFEKSLYNYSGGRQDNNFCVPLSYFPNMPKLFLDALGTGAIREKWYKYFGLNLSPIFGGESTKIGTIEFRHMVGNLDIPYIINWINLIISLKLTAKKTTYAELEVMLSEMNTTSSYYLLAENTFKGYQGLIVDQPSFKSDVEFGVTSAKQALLGQKNNKANIEIKMSLGKGK